MITVNMPAVRDELAATLQETLRLQQRLVDDVRDSGVVPGASLPLSAPTSAPPNPAGHACGVRESSGPRIG